MAPTYSTVTKAALAKGPSSANTGALACMANMSTSERMVQTLVATTQKGMVQLDRRWSKYTACADVHICMQARSMDRSYTNPKSDLGFMSAA